MSDKKLGFDLREVPRNSETEFIFEVAGRDSDSFFLALDEVYDDAMVELLYERRCNDSDVALNPIRYLDWCRSRQDAYVREHGHKAAFEKFFHGAAEFYYSDKITNRACQFMEKAGDVINKYRLYKSRYFDERL